MATTFGLNLALPAAMRGSSQLVRSSPLLLDRPAAAAVAGHAAAGTAVSGLDATRQQIPNGRVDRDQMIHAGMNDALFSGAGDVVRRLPWVGRGPGLQIVPGAGAFGAGPQKLQDALRHGVDLNAQEGVLRGHTLARHVGKRWVFLQGRLDSEPGFTRSSFTDQRVAERAITEVLRRNEALVLAYERRAVPRVPPMSLTFEAALGKVLSRDGDKFLGRTCVVVVRRDAWGVYVKTAWLER
jgi:hypothetical protein